MSETVKDFDWWSEPRAIWGTKEEEWPPEAPVLGSKNICQDGTLGSADCRCLLAWACGFPNRYLKTVDETIAAVICERKPDMYIDEFNESQSAKACAEVWNESMRRLEYDA